MDGASFAFATIGIAGTALQNILTLRDLLYAVKHAPEEATEIAQGLDAIQTSLKHLGYICSSENAIPIAALQDLKKTNIAETINKCGKACERFKTTVKIWKGDSRGDNLSMFDRFKIAVLEKERIEKFRVQVQSCRDQVHFAVAVTQLSSQLRAENNLEVDRVRIQDDFMRLQAGLEECIDKIETTQDAIKMKEESMLKDMNNVEQSAQDVMIDEPTRDRLLELVEMQSEFVAEDHKVCKTLYKEVCRITSVMEQGIGDVITSNNSYAFVGVSKDFFGTVKQRIGNVTTDSNSSSIVGVGL